MKNLDLDVDTPEKVAPLLRAAADAYYQTESELSSAWGDPNAGKIWTKIARILERAAISIDKATRDYY
jgi:hypothetical protein